MINKLKELWNMSYLYSAPKPVRLTKQVSECDKDFLIRTMKRRKQMGKFNYVAGTFKNPKL